MRHVHAAARQMVGEGVGRKLLVLDDRARAAIGCAALLGYRIDATILATCIGESVESTFDLLRRTEDLGLVVAERQPPGDTHRFQHHVTRAAIVQAMAPEQRRALHASIAEVLERRPDAAVRVEQIAHHWSEARRCDKGSTSGVVRPVGLHEQAPTR